MTIETWFPSFVFYEDIEIDSTVASRAVDAIWSKQPGGILETTGTTTATQTPNDLHLDEGVKSLLDEIKPALLRFFFDVMAFDSTRVEFQIGRCWPVVQTGVAVEGGRWHSHQGAAFSAVFYLRAPTGAGGLEFHQPHDAPYKQLPTRAIGPLTYRTTTYEPIENRLVVFSSDLVHRRLANAPECVAPRVAIAFDIYSEVALDAIEAGRPRQHLLLPI